MGPCSVLGLVRLLGLCWSLRVPLLSAPGPSVHAWQAEEAQQVSNFILNSCSREAASDLSVSDSKSVLLTLVTNLVTQQSCRVQLCDSLSSRGQDPPELCCVVCGGSKS